MTEPLPVPTEFELLSFRLAEQEYCIDIMLVREIRGWTRPTPLPHSPAHLCGVINQHGTVLPVVDLSVRLGMAPTGGDSRNVIVVVQVGGHSAGLLVDAVSDIIALPRSDMQPPPDLAADTAHRFIAALSIADGRMIRVLDLAAVLSGVARDAA